MVCGMRGMWRWVGVGCGSVGVMECSVWVCGVAVGMWYVHWDVGGWVWSVGVCVGGWVWSVGVCVGGMCGMWSCFYTGVILYAGTSSQLVHFSNHLYCSFSLS